MESPWYLRQCLEHWFLQSFGQWVVLIRWCVVVPFVSPLITNRTHWTDSACIFWMICEVNVKICQWLTNKKGMRSLWSLQRLVLIRGMPLMGVTLCTQEDEMQLHASNAHPQKALLQQELPEWDVLLVSVIIVAFANTPASWQKHNLPRLFGVMIIRNSQLAHIVGLCLMVQLNALIAQSKNESLCQTGTILLCKRNHSLIFGKSIHYLCQHSLCIDSKC